jgi:hypothetical protein
MSCQPPRIPGFTFAVSTMLKDYCDLHLAPNPSPKSRTCSALQVSLLNDHTYHPPRCPSAYSWPFSPTLVHPQNTDTATIIHNSFPSTPTSVLQIRVSCSGCQETNLHFDSYAPDLGDNASSASGMSLPSFLASFSTKPVPRTHATSTSRPRRCAHATSTIFSIHPTNYHQCPPASRCPWHTTPPTLSITGFMLTATFAALYLLR